MAAASHSRGRGFRAGLDGVGHEGPGNEAPDLQTVGDGLGRLDSVSEVDVRTEGGVVHVSFEGGKAEQEEIEGAIRNAGYDIFKVSHRDNEG